MTARDELAVLLANHESMGCGCCAYGPTTPEQSKAADVLEVSDYMVVLADAILAAGYRKPRTITTVEELDALPDGSIVRDAKGFAWQKYRRPISQNPAWFAATRDDDFYNSSDFIDANRTPISVLWEQS